MPKRCKYCFSRLNEKDPVCSVCKIDSAKAKKDLTKQERKVSYLCRTLSLMGFLAIVGGAFGIITFLPYAKFILQGEVEIIGNPDPYSVFYLLSSFVLSVIFIIFGLALRRYKKWCYIGGIIIYAFFVLLHLPGLNVVPLLIGALFLYYISTRTSKKILYRQL
ncbi:hypothetical protein ACFL3J_01620 [Candidatus Omnitrophota bacterium]